MATMGAQEGDGGGQLRTAGVVADPAVDHRAGRLARAAEFDQPQRRMTAAQRRVHLVGIALLGIHVGACRIGLDSLGKRVAQR